MKHRLVILALLLSLGGCDSSPQRKQAEALAKRNPLDMADEDAKTIEINAKKVKPPKAPKVQTVDAGDAQFIAGKRSKIYHCRTCEYAGKLDAPVGFLSCDDAERSGRIPCEFCKPRESAASNTPP